MPDPQINCLICDGPMTFDGEVAYECDTPDCKGLLALLDVEATKLASLQHRVAELEELSTKVLALFDCDSTRECQRETCALMDWWSELNPPSEAKQRRDNQ